MRAKLLKEHIDNGKRCAVGDVIELDQDLYEWLVGLKVAEYYAGSDAKVVPVEAEAKAGTEGSTVADAAPATKKGWGKSSTASEAPAEPKEVPVI